MSLRSSVIVAGSTMSAWRAIGVQNGSWTTIVSGRASARRRRFEVLVVVEGVAAAPVHEPDVGVGEPLAVVVERLARVEQHVGDAGDRDERAHGVVALRQASAARRAAARGRCRRSSRSRGRSRRRAARSGRASPPASPPIHGACSPCSARCSDQFTVIERPLRGHPPGQRADRRGRDPGERARPTRASSDCRRRAPST